MFIDRSSKLMLSQEVGLSLAGIDALWGACRSVVWEQSADPNAIQARDNSILRALAHSGTDSTHGELV